MEPKIEVEHPQDPGHSQGEPAKNSLRAIPRQDLSILIAEFNPEFHILAEIPSAHSAEIRFATILALSQKSGIYLISGGYDKLIKLWKAEPSTGVGSNKEDQVKLTFKELRQW